MLEKIIKGIKYLLYEENLIAEVIQKKGYEGDFIIPEIVVFKKVAYRVTSISWWAFEGCDSLTSIVIPDSVTSIEEYAFEGCTSLTTVILPVRMRDINLTAFYKCPSLSTIYVPAKTTDYYRELLPEKLHDKIVELAPEKKTKTGKEC